MGPAVRADVVRDPGRSGRGLAASGQLAVQHPQGVAQPPPLAVLAQGLGRDAGEILAQSLVVGRPAAPAAQGVDLQAQAPEAQASQEAPEHEDDFGVGLGLVGPDDLGVDLVELAHAPLLGAFVAEHGAEGVHPAHRLAGPSPALDVGPDDAGRGLGPQGQGAALAIREGVHLLAHHIGLFADGSGEEFGALQHRGPQLLVAVAREDLPGHGLHAGEGVAFRGKEIRKSP